MHHVEPNMYKATVYVAVNLIILQVLYMAVVH